MLWDDFLKRFTDIGIAYDRDSGASGPVPTRHTQPSRKAQRLMSPATWLDLPEQPHAVGAVHERVTLHLGCETQSSSAETLAEPATQASLANVTPQLSPSSVLRPLPPKPRHPPPPEELQARDESPLGKAMISRPVEEAAVPTQSLSPREAALKEVALAAEEISLREAALREAAKAAEEISSREVAIVEVPSPQRHRTRLVAALAADLRARAPRQSILKEVARQLLAMDEV